MLVLRLPSGSESKHSFSTRRFLEKTLPFSYISVLVSENSIGCYGFYFVSNFELTSLDISALVSSFSVSTKPSLIDWENSFEKPFCYFRWFRLLRVRTFQTVLTVLIHHESQTLFNLRDFSTKFNHICLSRNFFNL